MTAPRPAPPAASGETVRPIASALLTAGSWTLARTRHRSLGALLVAASLILVVRQRRGG